MATPYEITYDNDASNPVKLTVLPGDDGVRIEWRTEINRNITSTGRFENIVQNTLRYVTFDCYFQEAAFHAIETWLSFAQQGRPFTFTKDASKGAWQTLASSHAVGVSTLTVSSSPTGFDIGDYIIVRNSSTTNTHWDVCEITDLNLAVIDISPPTTHAYAQTDRVDWYYYFKDLYLLDEKFDPDRDGAFWHHTFNCVEVRNDA